MGTGDASPDRPPAANTTELDTAARDTEAFAERFLQSTLGLIDMLAIYVGDRLGFYRSLADAGRNGVTVSELAAATDTAERYTREWLEQQAVCGILRVRNDDVERRFSLSGGASEVLANPDSLSYMAPMARMFAASMVQLPALLDAYRSGGGVSWAQLGEDARESQADINRPWFLQRLAPSLARVDELNALLARPATRIVDVACGLGWSTIALARAFPDAALVGVDIDEQSILSARRHANEAGLSDRIEFEIGDASALDERLASSGAPGAARDPSAPTPRDGFHAAFIFEALHDMPHPVPVLHAVRSTLAADGVLVVMDEAVADEFTQDGDEIERLMYGYSLFVCLPDSLSTRGSVATGTVMRRATLETYAHEAGFSGVEVLPIDDFGAFRFYLLKR